MSASHDADRRLRALELLRREGVHSLDDLAGLLLAEADRTGASEEDILYRRASGKPVGLAQPASPALPWRAGRTSGPYRHRPTQLPILLDDKHEIAPGEVAALDGLALDYVWDDAAAERQVLRAFSVTQEALDYMRAQPVRTASPGTGTHSAGEPGTSAFHHVDGTPATLWEHVDFSGWRIDLDLGHVLPDLTEVHMAGILWWWTSWNDQISSVRAGSGWLTLWEHVYPATYGLPPGSKLHVQPFQSIADLGAKGFNDRISAVNHHYFAF
ncbi:hypothetical protein [Streptosporangium sp. NPDC049644]|uniref:hypothetical protein n=1 Tax=Streptosporangium sp. NPDC049644 TaxID=3155507 RepID=UPI003427D03D